jgi:hypothetical protein
LAEFQLTHATTRVEHQRRVVALHNFPAERAQAVLANYEGTLQRIREDQGHPRRAPHFEPTGRLLPCLKWHRDRSQLLRKILDDGLLHVDLVRDIPEGDEAPDNPHHERL